MTGPIYLPLCTIAGSDPTGGAGLQIDLRTFAAHGGAGSAVVTAVTVQGRGGVAHVEPVPPRVVADQLDVVLEEVRPRALKTGMLWSAETVRAVTRRLAGAGIPIVVDPVLVATAGGGLLAADALAPVRDALAPLATVLTPNLPEAAALLGRAEIAPGDAPGAAEALRRALGAGAVLLKGGHAGGDVAVDHLATARGLRTFSLPRVRGTRGHGTGCALAAALAARLGRGDALAAAVEGAKGWVHRALVAATRRGDDWGLFPEAAAPDV